MQLNLEKKGEHYRILLVELQNSTYEIKNYIKWLGLPRKK